MMSVSSIAEYSIRQLFSSGQYVIPLYQRNYAWTEKEVLQLIQDIADYAAHEHQPTYRIGTLIVYERGTERGLAHETIDGQQRLTTLNILLCVLKREFADQVADMPAWFRLNLAYDSRPAATATLQALFQDGPLPPVVPGQPFNLEIRQAYEVAARALHALAAEKQLSVAAFCRYLLHHVCLLFVPVPPDTDLNHYFEIMNSRGEQLEKHEVLKADFLSVLQADPAASHCFNHLWEACADMERYVQYGFTPPQRTQLFGDEWTRLLAPDFEAVLARLGYDEAQASQAEAFGIEDALHDGALPVRDTPRSGDPEEFTRFNSVINFPNFLLHILRIQVAREEAGRTKRFADWEEVRLDDKELLPSFRRQLALATDKPAFAKTFAYNLLKGKHLLDTYVLKREYDNAGDKWSLKELKKKSPRSVYYKDTLGDGPGGLNREVLMLLAMFHVSTPTLIYKHWLSAALHYLFGQPQVVAQGYRDCLQELANAFLFNRFLAQGARRKDYYALIYGPHGTSLTVPTDDTLLHQGTAVENFVFNYLDFLLWKHNQEKYRDFEFTFRSSVEHYYPQHPLGGQPLPERYLHHFGNLCLISAAKNSALKNYLPSAKRTHYNLVKPDSLKQGLMMAEGAWTEAEIIRHGEAMRNLLLSQKHDGGISPALLLLR